MNSKIEKMMEEIEEMKQKLRTEIDKEEKKIRFEIKNGAVIFERDILSAQKAHMKALRTWFRETPFIQFLSAPIIYGMVIPAVILDIALFLYKIVVGKVFDIKFAERKAYIVFDRQYLGYLNIIEKFNCMYCSYFNGLMHYATAIAGRTELYFCPIRHAKKVAYEHPYYDKFFRYAEGESYQERLKTLREKTKGR
jgi:hypothetical protein